MCQGLPWLIRPAPACREPPGATYGQSREAAPRGWFRLPQSCRPHSPCPLGGTCLGQGLQDPLRAWARRGPLQGWFGPRSDGFSPSSPRRKQEIQAGPGFFPLGKHLTLWTVRVEERPHEPLLGPLLPQHSVPAVRRRADPGPVFSLHLLSGCRGSPLTCLGFIYLSGPWGLAELRQAPLPARPRPREI